MEIVCAGFYLPSILQIFKFSYLPHQQFMLLTCPLEKEGIIVKSIFSHFLSSLAGCCLALVKLTSLLCFRTLSQILFILMKKYRWKSKVPLSSFQPDPRAQLFSTATPQLPCKPRHRHSLAAAPLASPIHHRVLPLQNWRTDLFALTLQQYIKDSINFAWGSFWD